MSTESHAKNIIIAKKRNLQGSQFKLTLARHDSDAIPPRRTTH